MSELSVSGSGSSKPPPTAPSGSAGSAATGATSVVAASEEFAEFLEIMNGTDAYNSASVSMGKLEEKEFMLVPTGFVKSVFNAGLTGSTEGMRYLSSEEFAQVYALNKNQFGNDTRALKIALLRVLAVKMGWLTGDYEVREVEPMINAVEITNNDITEIKANFEKAKVLAVMIPFAAEFVFRTMGHHYLTGLGPEFTDKYQRFFNACVLRDLTSYLPAQDLFHTALHWVSLKEAYLVARSPAASNWLPNAVVIRVTSAPAGTALISTSVAIMNAMDGAGLKKPLVEASGIDVDLIETVNAAVLVNPGKYHTIPQAYKESPLGVEAERNFLKAKEEAIKLSPVLQGFLDALPNSSSLSKAKALEKHAANNPVLMKKAKVFFKEIGITKAGNMKELFSGMNRTKAAVKNEEVEDDD